VLEQLTPFAWLAVFATIALAALVHGALGLGFPLVATPLLTLVTDLRSAILLTLLPTIAINLVSIASDREWRTALRQFWLLPVATIVGSWSGTQVILQTDPAPFRLLLAGVILLYLLVDRWRKQAHRRVFEPTVGLVILTGVVSGLLAGLVNVLAPILIIFALETRLAAPIMVSVFNATFLSSKTGQLLGFGVHGAIDHQVLLLWLALIPFAVSVLWYGIRIRRRTDTERYQRWLKTALWVIAALLVAQHLFDTWTTPDKL
jgi:uncharacterized membrane protein YfcA